jgi:glycosyltransferase involved in cell wall biosynthesis/tetratricopeptide (TPR) repeat protein
MRWSVLHMLPLFFEYFYAVDLDAQNNIREVLIHQRRERILRNDGTFRWISRLHETAIAQRQENLAQYDRPECKVIHLTSTDRMDKNMDRNIEILEMQAREEQMKDPRTVMYLAKSYFDRGRMVDDFVKRKIDFDMAAQLFHSFLQGFGDVTDANYVEGSGWKEDRSQAYRYIGEIAFLSGNYEMCEKAMQSAIDEHPYYPDYYVNLAMAYASMHQYGKARHWLTLATAVEAPKTSQVTMPRDLKARALEVDYHICMNTGMPEKALEDAQLLCQIDPKNTQHKERLEITQKLVTQNKVAQCIVYLGKYLEENNDLDSLGNLVKAIPPELRQEQFASQMRHKFMPSRKHQSNEISLLCGPGLEEWSPNTAKEKGIGGSEEAVIYLSQELTKLGWVVTVYANPGKDAGIIDGVNYQPWYDFNLNDEFNVLVLWRMIGAVDANFKAKMIMVWMHDVPNCAEFTPERVDKVDKIAVLSEYHKSILFMVDGNTPTDMPAKKIFLTANGIPEIKTYIPSKKSDLTNVITLGDKKELEATIDQGRVDAIQTQEDKSILITPIERNPHSMIYSSSPDRGLIHLLNNWQKIRAEVPDATLDVYYGFETFDAIHANNPPKMQWKARMMKLMEQEGITYHGRVSHQKLHEAMAKTAIWAYPTHFTEISCITAMKAQTLGAIPVTVTLAALDETVKNGIKVDVDILKPEGLEEYLAALTTLLKDEHKQEEIREGMMKWAKSYFGWGNVAINWDQTFHAILSDPQKGMDKNAI